MPTLPSRGRCLASTEKEYAKLVKAHAALKAERDEFATLLNDAAVALDALGVPRLCVTPAQRVRLLGKNGFVLRFIKTKLGTWGWTKVGS